MVGDRILINKRVAGPRLVALVAVAAGTLQWVSLYRRSSGRTYFASTTVGNHRMCLGARS